MRQELYDARKKYGFTQEQLARASGIERTTYNRIERGTRKPDIDMALRIANVLNKPVEDIFLSSQVLKKHNEDSCDEACNKINTKLVG